MTLGPMMIDVAGVELTAEERERLQHPAVGGVILFGRNCESAAQVATLTREIRALRRPRLLIAIDQEGGRVQRLREGLARLPPARRLGALFDRDPAGALAAAREFGWLLAAELLAVGLDMSFTPVVDLDRGLNSVIGDRALHTDPIAVGALASALSDGLQQAGMAAVAKHFPGHGGVAADSHHELPIDPRPLGEIEADLKPFRRLIEHQLAGVMVAHIVFPDVDSSPAGFSRRWIGDILRGRLGFGGAVFSDDLSMGGAAGYGDYPTRARAALAAGVDMALVCNHPEAAAGVLDALGDSHDPIAQSRLIRFHSRVNHPDLRAVQTSRRWLQARRALEDLA